MHAVVFISSICLLALHSICVFLFVWLGFCSLFVVSLAIISFPTFIPVLLDLSYSTTLLDITLKTFPETDIFCAVC